MNDHAENLKSVAGKLGKWPDMDELIEPIRAAAAEIARLESEVEDLVDLLQGNVLVNLGKDSENRKHWDACPWWALDVYLGRIGVALDAIAKAKVQPLVDKCMRKDTTDGQD